MTDVKRTLAQACDQITDCLFKQGPMLAIDSLHAANETLVAVRENLQNLLGELMQAEKQDRE